MRRFRCLLTLDSVIEEYVHKAYPQKPTVPVPWGVDFDFDRYEHKPAGGALRVLSVGHLTPMRSRAALIDAASFLSKAGLPFTIRIVGKICTEEPLERVRALGLGQQVVFLGELPREQVLRELCECDVHAMWITNPGVGSAGMEAMSVGVPALMWASPDQLGFVPLEHMKTAVLIDPARPETIASALRELAMKPDLRECIGRNARSLARDNFSWPRIAVRMGEIYRQIISADVVSR